MFSPARNKMSATLYGMIHTVTPCVALSASTTPWQAPVPDPTVKSQWHNRTKLRMLALPQKKTSKQLLDVRM
jgi:hypothetical protein